MECIEVLKEFKWKKLFILALIGVFLQDIIIERAIPFLLLNNAVDISYQEFSRAAQIILYVALAVYLYRSVDDYRWLHLASFAIIAVMLSSIVLFIFTVILSSQPGLSILIAVGNFMLLITLILAVVLGAIISVIYEKIMPEDKSKLLRNCFFIGISLVALIVLIESFLTFWLAFPIEDHLFLTSILHSGPFIFIYVFYTIFMMIPSAGGLFLFLGIPPSTSLSFNSFIGNLGVYLAYYTLFFFLIGYFYIRSKESYNKAGWIILMILPIAIHLIAAGYIFLAQALS
jgi:hypothetical protein